MVMGGDCYVATVNAYLLQLVDLIQLATTFKSEDIILTTTFQRWSYYEIEIQLLNQLVDTSQKTELMLKGMIQIYLDSR